MVMSLLLIMSIIIIIIIVHLLPPIIMAATKYFQKQLLVKQTLFVLFLVFSFHAQHSQRVDQKPFVLLTKRGIATYDFVGNGPYILCILFSSVSLKYAPWPYASNGTSTAVSVRRALR